MRRLVTIGLCAAALSGCQLLDEEVPVVDHQGTVVGTTTVGDIIADSAEPASNAAGSVIGALTGNPILGGAAAAGLAGLFAGARRKRKAVVEQEA